MLLKILPWIGWFIYCWPLGRRCGLILVPVERVKALCTAFCVVWIIILFSWMLISVYIWSIWRIDSHMVCVCTQSLLFAAGLRPTPAQATIISWVRSCTLILLPCMLCRLSQFYYLLICNLKIALHHLLEWHLLLHILWWKGCNFLLITTALRSLIPCRQACLHWLNRDGRNVFLLVLMSDIA